MRRHIRRGIRWVLFPAEYVAACVVSEHTEVPPDR
jgi:hypothetical protein